MQYQIVPVIGTSEILSCQKAPSPGCGAGEGSIVCIQWPACTLVRCTGEPPRKFIRGDTDGDGRYIISDGIQILDRLFSGRQAFGSNCDDTGDFDDSGALDLGDAISVFNFLFAQGREPKAPYPGCGEDPTADDLPCAGPNPACP